MAVGDSVALTYRSGDTIEIKTLTLESAELVDGNAEVTISLVDESSSTNVLNPAPTVEVSVVGVGSASVEITGALFGQREERTLTIPNTPPGSSVQVTVTDFDSLSGDPPTGAEDLPLFGTLGKEPPPPDDEPPDLEPPEPEPTPSPEPDEFTIPFSILNAAPWVKGVEDVILTIPQIEDIEDIVDNAVPSLFDIGEEIEQQLELFDFPEPPSVDDIAEEIEQRVDLPDVPDLGDIREEIDAALAELDLPDVPSLDEIVDGVTEEIDSLIQDVQDAVSDVERGIDQTIASVDRELTEQLSALEQQVDETIAPLGETVDEIQAAVDDIPDEIQGVRDRLDELAEETAAAVREEIEPSINDVGLFEDPVGFAGELVQEGIDRQVSEETAERLSERVND